MNIVFGKQKTVFLRNVVGDYASHFGEVKDLIVHFGKRYLLPGVQGITGDQEWHERHKEVLGPGITHRQVVCTTFC